MGGVGLTLNPRPFDALDYNAKWAPMTRRLQVLLMGATH
jgi:hypothetical protein